MKFKNPYLQKFWKFSVSFNLGIPVMVAITSLIAWGTIVEAQYDAWTAGQVVYRSWMMYVAMGLLVYNLTAVMIDRLPWKKNHYPFVLVHIGIILLILGGAVTQKWGLDGSMPIPLGGKSNLVTVPETDFVIYATFDGDRYSKVHDREVNFYKKPPTPQNPYSFDLSDGQIQITDYVPYARVNQKTVADTENQQAGSSVKFQLANANVKQIETLTQGSVSKSVDVNFGPLKVYLGHDWVAKGRARMETNELYLLSKDVDSVSYFLFDKNSNQPYAKGTVKIGETIQTHWMGLELKLLDYLQRAKSEWDVKPGTRPTPLTSAAIKLKYKDKEYWMVLNDVLKVFGSDVAYLMSYQNRRIQLDFPVKLDRFEVQRYQGTMKAKQYASNVTVGDASAGVSAEISMNEPLKYQGFTFYQSSFQQDEKTGEPTASVFSVNHDPGRWIKYLGSIVMSIGIVWLFYQKRKRRTAV